MSNTPEMGQVAAGETLCGGPMEWVDRKDWSVACAWWEDFSGVSGSAFHRGGLSCMRVGAISQGIVVDATVGA